MAALSESEWPKRIRLPLRTEFDQTCLEASTQCLLLVSLCFSGQSKNKDGADLVSDWLKIFNFSSSIACRTEFDETWHEASIQCPLPSFFFFFFFFFFLGGGVTRKQICTSCQLYGMPYLLWFPILCGSQRVAGQLCPWTTRPVDSSARSGQLGPYVPDNSARRFNILNACLQSKLIKY